jgi:sugar lactone lactonase YvrE
MKTNSHVVRPLVWAGLLLGGFVTTRAASDHSTPYSFTTLAGAASIGSTDGPGGVARFQTPRGVAVDRTGNVYVADTVNHTIRKITPAGIVSTLAGTPGMSTLGRTDAELLPIDGTGAAAVFTNPEGIAVDDSGTLYVADKLISTIRKISPAGVVTTWAGTPRVGGSVDGTGSAARFYIPGGVAVDSAGNVYVAEWVTHIIRKITPAGVVSTLAGLADTSGSADGPGGTARFFQPRYVTVDRAGNVFVSDAINCTIRKISPEGVVSTFAGTAGSGGAVDGAGGTARFSYPSGIAVDPAGNLYVADSGNNLIRKITPAGIVSTLAGAAGIAGSADGVGAAARFRGPSGLAVDAAGTVYVADESDNTIRQISPAGEVTTLAGLGLDNSLGSTDGTGRAARFNVLASAAMGPQGELYAADPLNATIRKITPAGVVSTLAGSAGHSGRVDGTGSAARFYIPSGVAVDNAGTVYVTDSGNNTIRKVTPAGIVSTLAGTAAVYGSADGTGADAQFFYPYAIAADAAGTLYVTEIGNYAIRKITPAGVVTTLAGAAGQPGSADGTGRDARFRSPESITVDATGNVYVSDMGNNAIRKITPAGVVTTLPATAFAPGTITVDGAGNLFVADSTIRKITPAGEVSTLAGLNQTTGSADGMGREVRFNDPRGIALDAAGNLYVTSDSTVRKGQLAGPPVIISQPQSQTVAAGANVQFVVTATGAPAPTYQWNFNGSLFSGATSSTLSFANVTATDAGDYTVVVTNELGAVTSSKATLAISVAPTSPSSSGNAGGGGSIDGWLVLTLFALGAARTLAAPPAIRGKAL